MRKIIHVVGARPNFMKISPLMKEIDKSNYFDKQILIHTGQHYDKKMSDAFFDDLSIPKPNYNLGIGSGSQTFQTANIMIAVEKVLIKENPDCVLVVGDVNSTLATALVCAKLNFKLIHLESGLRSYDNSMPEEINRILTDRLSDLLLTPSQDANDNLIKEGIQKNKIKFVGNIMIDSLKNQLPKAKLRAKTLLSSLEIKEKEYILTTLHRPSNVDKKFKLKKILKQINKLGEKYKVIFPLHPRTKKTLDKLENNFYNICFIEPLSYIDFLSLELNSKLVITDSGGIQEETTFLNIPCATLRKNTERPITIKEGTNILIEKDENIELLILELLKAKTTSSKRTPKFWDGNTASRVLREIISQKL